MKSFEKIPDGVKGLLFTGKNTAELKKYFNIVEKDGVTQVVTPTGNKDIKPNQYVYILGIDILVENKSKFEKTYKEVK